MKEKWTGRIVGKMHNHGIRACELATELGVSKYYISLILNGKRNPPGAKERLESAVDAMIARRKERGNAC